ncbi:hypothetical protein BDV41DRAFT_556989 [Aspergillus transmontanensis]|uniref:Uncharacterized protein n=1 Tax=Aspergillus transmontanensis TaxID=1034304 RepID=A0A5N6VEV8_9EURO|nr:hypothetical protein BDV41DRAFT_556989 [Aspergillus transmontanensis]
MFHTISIGSLPIGVSACNQIHRDLTTSSIIGIFGLIITTYVTFIPRLGYKSAFYLTALAAATCL